VSKNRLSQLQQRTADNSMMVFTGNANPQLSSDVARFLNVPLGKASVESFSDGEVMVEILDNVRGKDVFIVQPTCMPANENLMELMVMTDALRRASAKRITLVIPWVTQDRIVDRALLVLLSLLKSLQTCSRGLVLTVFSLLICMQTKYKDFLTAL